MKVDNISNYKFNINKNDDNFKLDNKIIGSIISVDSDIYTIKFDNECISNIDISSDKCGEILNIGDKIEFNVVDDKSNKVNLQINNILKQNRENETSDRESKIKTNNFNAKTIKFLKENNKAINKENINKVNYIEKSINSIVKKLTEDDINKMNDDLIDVEKIKLDSLNMLIKDNKLLNIDNGMIANIVENNIKNEESNIKFINILKKNNLPTHQENVNYLKNITHQYNIVKDFDLNDVIKSLKGNSEITLENLYKSKYTKNNIQDINVDLDIEEEIRKLFKIKNIECTGENISVAKEVFRNGLDINISNITNIKDILNVLDNCKYDDLINEALNNLKFKDSNKIYFSKKVQDINYDRINKEIKEIRNNIKLFKDSDIRNALFKKKNISINDIKNSMLFRNKYNLNKSDNLNKELHSDIDKIKIDLETIRKKMTYDAIIKFKNNSIDIKSNPISKIAKDLNNQKQIEKIEGKDILVENKNVREIKQIYDSINMIKNKNYTRYIKIIQKDEKFNLDNLKKYNMEDVIKTYDNNLTRVSYKYNDSKNKLGDELNNLLKEIKVELTDDNIKISKILLNNNMDLTKENINIIKQMDYKLDFVLESMHPEIVMDMINEKLNPMTEHIDNLISYIDGYEDKYGNDLYDKLSNIIVDLESENKISQDDKKTIISFYKIFNNIKKSKSLALGLVYKNNIKFTLENMLKGNKDLKKINKNIDVLDIEVDDSVGEIKEYKNKSKSIKDIISKSIDIIEDKQSIIKQKLHSYKENSEILNKINNIKGLNKSDIQLFKDNNLPLNIKTLNNIINIREDKFYLGKTLSDLNNQIKENNNIIEKIALSNKENLYDILVNKKSDNNIKGVLKNIHNKLFESKEISNCKINKNIDDLKDLVDTIDIINKEEDMLQIPIYMGGKITNLNIWFDEDKESDGQNNKKKRKVKISMQTSNLGKIDISINFNNKDKISINVNSDNKKDSKNIKKFMEELNNIVQQSDYDIDLLSLQSKKDSNKIDIKNVLKVRSDGIYEQYV